MTRLRPRQLFAIALLLAAAGSGAGCTLFGDQFETDQPEAELTLVGTIHVDRSSGSNSCTAGDTIFWGNVRNSGDLDLDAISITIQAYGAGGGLIGVFSGDVYAGTVTSADEDVAGSIDTASTSLEVDEAGSFNICAPLPYGSVASTTYSTDATYIDDSEDE